jgi:hypothetical protein
MRRKAADDDRKTATSEPNPPGVGRDGSRTTTAKIRRANPIRRTEFYVGWALPTSSIIPTTEGDAG